MKASRTLLLTRLLVDGTPKAALGVRDAIEKGWTAGPG